MADCIQLGNAETCTVVPLLGDHPPIMKMTAETEDSEVSEVAIADEKSQFGMSSGDGISHHNEANDHKKVSEGAAADEKCQSSMISCDEISPQNQANDDKNFWIDVVEADGINNGVTVDENVVDGGSSVPPESSTIVDDQAQELDAQSERLDAVNGELSKPPNVEENENVKWMNEFPPLVSRNTTKQESSPEEHSRNTNSWLDVVKKPYEHIPVKTKPGFYSSTGSSSGEVTSAASIASRTEVFDSFDAMNYDASNNGGNRFDIKFNARSTFRRSGTFDGRSLGSDKRPHILPSCVRDRVDGKASRTAGVDSVSQTPAFKLKQETTVKNVTSDGKMLKKLGTQKNQKVKNMGISDEVRKNEPKKSAKGVELARSAEETRRKEAEATLKEQLRLEELAKANEARERKRREEEKAQMRAELKARKEAEQKDKERERRLRKKERKKAAAGDVHDTNNNCETAASSNNGEQVSRDMASVMSKKPQNPRLSPKQSKKKSIPPPPRNRNKNICRQWMWVSSICLAIFAILWVRNTGMFSNVKLNWRSLS